MSARAQFGQGTKLLISDRDESEPSYVDVAELTNISGLDATADEIDYTSHSSYEGWRQFIQGLKDAGGLDIDGNYVTDESLLNSGEGQDIIDEAFNYGGHIPMAIAWPVKGSSDYLVLEFVGFLTARRNPSAPVDDLIDFSATIKATGWIPDTPTMEDIDTLDPSSNPALPENLE